ncbi:unnamed protein product [Darwinula stevensoni]|uniref:Uncharacterized protein n=1 Tax=Darwinula stevensoni TaxID=69355 RepID=A0A7R8XMH8_9CRUS|nr:unnamed protein product [Darwinula stevensoni]CAG0895644.1 unnamed protein product [Darwinula stevensoni]
MLVTYDSKTTSPHPVYRKLEIRLTVNEVITSIEDQVIGGKQELQERNDALLTKLLSKDPGIWVPKFHEALKNMKRIDIYRFLQEVKGPSHGNQDTQFQQSACVAQPSEETNKRVKVRVKMEAMSPRHRQLTAQKAQNIDSVLIQCGSNVSLLTEDVPYKECEDMETCSKKPQVECFKKDGINILKDIKVGVRNTYKPK